VSKSSVEISSHDFFNYVFPGFLYQFLLQMRLWLYFSRVHGCKKMVSVRTGRTERTESTKGRV